MKEIIFLLTLGIPLSASSVTYTLATSNGLGFRATASDFLPAIYPIRNDFILGLDAQLDYVNCGGPSPSFACDNPVLTLGTTGFATALIRINGNSFDYTLIEALFSGVDLAHVGTWTDTRNATTLTISQAGADPVNTPEPSSFLLLGLGLVAAKGSRRLFPAQLILK